MRYIRAYDVISEILYLSRKCFKMNHCRIFVSKTNCTNTVFRNKKIYASELLTLYTKQIMRKL